MVQKMIVTDWRAMKFYHKRAFIVPVFGFFAGIIWSPFLVIPSCVMMSLIFSINTFAVEEKGELNNLYLTFPVERSTIVKARFILSFIMGAGGGIAGIPITFLISYFRMSQYGYPLGSYLVVFACSYLLFSISSLSTYPALFCLGYSKGKAWGLYLPLLAIGILYGMIQLILSQNSDIFLEDVVGFADQYKLAVSGSMILFATFVLLLSFHLSKNLYEKRDF